MRQYTRALLVAALAYGACADPGSPTPPDAGPEATSPPQVAPSPEAARQEVSRTAAPAATPGPPRFIHSEDAEEIVAASAGMDAISAGLGYALAPSALPMGFRLTMARLVDLPDRPMATVFYQYGRMRLALFYPAQFAPVTDPGAERPFFSPPDDAVARVVVADELAYLMRGEWDDYTVQLMAAYTAQWEYNGRMTLYFPYEAASGRGGWAMLSVNTQREAWIDVTGLIAIAESVGPVP